MALCHRYRGGCEGAADLRDDGNIRSAGALVRGLPGNFPRAHGVTRTPVSWAILPAKPRSRVHPSVENIGLNVQPRGGCGVIAKRACFHRCLLEERFP